MKYIKIEFDFFLGILYYIECHTEAAEFVRE